MGQDQNDLFEQQRRQQMASQQKVRGTMETVGLEQRQAQSTISKYQPIVINVLAIIGVLAIAYAILSVLF